MLRQMRRANILLHPVPQPSPQVITCRFVLLLLLLLQLRTVDEVWHQVHQREMLKCRLELACEANDHRHHPHRAHVPCQR
jgi:hypothetical protein